jgi:hypothetical protein
MKFVELLMNGGHVTKYSPTQVRPEADGSTTVNERAEDDLLRAESESTWSALRPISFT